MAVTSGQGAASTEAAGPVVICCAEADLEAISAVSRELEQAGHSVEIVSGAESDAKGLAAAIEHRHGEGLYVLCRSRALGRDAVDALREVLLAKHVPFGRTLTVASTRQRELRDRILASLKRVAAGRVRRMSTIPPEGRKPKPTRLGIPTPKPSKPTAAAAAADAPKPRPRRRATQLGMSIPTIPSAQAKPKAAAPAPAATPRPAAAIQAPAPAPAAPDDDDDFATNAKMRAVEDPTQTDIETGEAEDEFSDEAPTDAATPRPDFAGPVDAAEDADLGADDPGLDTDDPGLDIDDPGLDIDEPDLDIDEPGLGIDEPGLDIDEPGLDIDEPAGMPAPAATEESVAAPIIAADEFADLDRTNPALELSASDLLIEDVASQVPIRTGHTSVTREALPPPVRSGDTVIGKAPVRSGVTLKSPVLDAEALASLGAPASPELPAAEGPELPDGRGLDSAVGLSSAPLSADPGANGLLPPVAPATGGLGPSTSGAASSIEADATDRPAWLIPAGLCLAAVVVLGTVLAFALGGDDEEDADPVASKEPSKASSKDDSQGKDDADSGRAEDVEAAPVADTRTFVGAALRDRKIQALDALFVTAETFGPTDLLSAEAHCNGLSIDGVGQWRLPELGELMSLTEAGMTGRGYYWSATPADSFGDSQLVWYARRKRIITRGDDNLTLCVRGSGSELDES